MGEPTKMPPLKNLFTLFHVDRTYLRLSLRLLLLLLPLSLRLLFWRFVIVFPFFLLLFRDFIRPIHSTGGDGCSLILPNLGDLGRRLLCLVQRCVEIFVLGMPFGGRVFVCATIFLESLSMDFTEA